MRWCIIFRGFHRRSAILNQSVNQPQCVHPLRNLSICQAILWLKLAYLTVLFIPQVTHSTGKNAIESTRIRLWTCWLLAQGSTSSQPLQLHKSGIGTLVGFYLGTLKFRRGILPLTPSLEPILLTASALVFVPVLKFYVKNVLPHTTAPRVTIWYMFVFFAGERLHTLHYDPRDRGHYDSRSPSCPAESNNIVVVGYGGTEGFGVVWNIITGTML